jgi:hypothetical protein
MKSGNKTSLKIIVVFAALVTIEVSAAESDSGFLDDYDKLEPISGSDARIYTAPGAYENFKNYTAVMIDQPEFIIAKDSKYRGVKPDDAKAVADTMRKAMTDQVSTRMKVVDKAGPGVLYIRMAASNIHLAKKKRGLLGYTPAGFIVGSATAAGQEMQQKILLQNMTLEMEVLDSQTQSVLAAVVDVIDASELKKASDSWAQEHTVMEYWATRFRCRLENSRKPKTEWQDCEKTLP